MTACGVTEYAACGSDRKRIVIVGCTGAGKTTLASRLAHVAGLAHIELDALRWEGNWTKTSDELFRQKVVESIQAPDSWVVDGNYEAVRDILWRRATTVIWLDVPFPVVCWRMLIRSAKQVMTAKELSNGNRETVRRALFSRHSAVYWGIYSYLPTRRECRSLFERNDYPHLELVRLRSPREVDRYLAGIK